MLGELIGGFNMCWNCCDCEVISAPGNPAIMQCIGFQERKPYVVMMGHLTEHYRWCSNWTPERIEAEEKRLLKGQNRGNLR